MAYLRTTIGRWTIDLDSAEAAAVFDRIAREGVEVFRAQPGFVRYRLMRADARTTVAVAEWESEDLGSAGAQRFRQWLQSSGIAQMLTLETYAGEIVVRS
jgi:heme-degrading monooxygenase HmoA